MNDFQTPPNTRETIFDRIPFAKWGWREILVFGAPLLAATIWLLCLGSPWAWTALLPAVLLAFVLYFFRDPPRVIPTEPSLIVSPADGRVVDIERIEHDEFLAGPATRIGIFLSVFNVHINRSPVRARVVDLHYKPGEFLNAMNPASAERNESMRIRLEELNSKGQVSRRMVVRQISGLIARRIVCPIEVGQVIDRGERFGMIKFGSRTELFLPHEPGLDIHVAIGDRVLGGATILAKYAASETRD